MSLKAILFVEDHKDLRDTAILALELESYAVRAAGDGLEALAILESGFMPDLIVSDIMMPRMDGYQLFEAVRQQKHLRSVPFIFLTARSSRQDVLIGRQLGVDDYLVKPFEPDELLAAIRTRLHRTDEIRADADESLHQARRQLVDMLAHEMRTPLTYVTGGFALLAEELQMQGADTLSNDLQTSLELIQSGTLRLNRLAEQMVIYAQVITGNMAEFFQAGAERLELAFVVYAAIDGVSPLARARGMTFQATLDETLVIRGLPNQLTIAIGEVLRNAIQYSPNGSQVCLTLAQEGDWVALTIADRGRGISAEDQVHIWDILIQSGRDRHEQQGTGMGLPIVKGIITVHGGQVALTSTPGQGTQVALRLPLARD
jgi:signal transduction histidine kinase